jgi:hypothetical protein
VPHVGTQGSDTDSAVQLQLGLAVGYRRTDLVELLLPVLSRLHPQSAGGGVPQASDATYPRPDDPCLGSVIGAQESDGARLHCRAARPNPHRVRTGVCAGLEPGGVFMGSLEAARTAQCLSKGLVGLERTSAANFTEDAPAAQANCCVLEAGRTILLIELYYAKLNRAI